ncbi:replication-relaxation family protein [Brevibacillus laterosporus]|uniref:replication-relaxation family protein n=1 Tax=Brevibacillus laterosporus TaxID=1465 RepID=UPI00215C24D0|nr:replication-relaxation family protein [Brevibacillus laterosporus]MCR8939816.1 replication-relaxation family protein [Brevibacillus laterosporus]MCZ0842456.1 replication-relaxation family protein [Brevibacillus laterosporus]MCZ0846453.1 replication-relaxation family protein [Brevibacillus laterosporus]
MNAATVKKQSRWMQILSSLDDLGFLTTSQIQRLHGLGSRRNTHRILTDMDSMLNSFRLEEAVYYLSASGRKAIGSKKVRRKTLTAPHTLLRNEVYIWTRPRLWKQEQAIKWEGKALIPDALYQKNEHYFFLEVDSTQSMTVNRQKINLYRELRDSGLFQKRFGQFPTIQFVTTTEYRRKALRAALDGLKSEALLHSEIK